MGAVAVVTQRDAGTVLACLDEAAAAGLVTSGGGWRFSDDLIREAALLELAAAGRLTAHARMAGYLRCRADAVPAVVAHHLLESLPAGDAAVAARWAERAAAAALAQLAWEDAAGFYAGLYVTVGLAVAGVLVSYLALRRFAAVPGGAEPEQGVITPDEVAAPL